jgi:hypothetical protein
VRFLPSAPFDDRLLTELREVARVEREGQHVVVTGTGELVNAVLSPWPRPAWPPVTCNSIRRISRTPS